MELRQLTFFDTCELISKLPVEFNKQQKIISKL